MMKNKTDYDKIQDKICKKIIETSCGWINNIVMATPTFISCLLGFVRFGNDKSAYQGAFVILLTISLVLYVVSIYLKICAKYLLIVTEEISDYDKEFSVDINKYEVIVKVANILPKIMRAKKWLGLDCENPLKSAVNLVCYADILLLLQLTIFISVMLIPYVI